MPDHTRTDTPFSSMPERFFEVVIHDIGRDPKFTSFDAGYELGKWRHEDFAEYLMEWLLEYALNYSELSSCSSATGRILLRKAACNVYSTDKYGYRGEIGEILLHALIRQEFNSQPAISKVYHKTSSNDTVKGFDAVHVVETDNGIELWLGEVKYYSDINRAIRDVVKELNDHFESDFLRKEFLFIGEKIDANWKYASDVKDIISCRKSLDDIFTCICIPVLLTYESNVLANYQKKSEEFTDKLIQELEKIYKRFTSILLPLENPRNHVLYIWNFSVSKVRSSSSCLFRCRKKHLQA